MSMPIVAAVLQSLFSSVGDGASRCVASYLQHQATVRQIEAQQVMLTQMIAFEETRQARLMEVLRYDMELRYQFAGQLIDAGHVDAAVRLLGESQQRWQDMLVTSQSPVLSASTRPYHQTFGEVAGGGQLGHADSLLDAAGLKRSRGGR